MFEAVTDRSRELLPDVIEFRRALHRNPETGLNLPGTKTLVLETLTDLPLKIIEHEQTSGIVAVLEGAKPGPTVLLRGDMDGLPLVENTGLDFASVTGDTMHACGHDLHTAMLMGAATLLSERSDGISGNVVFMFQPGEEGYHGARFMIEEGLLDVTGTRPSLALAIHITTMYESGVIAVRPGVAMASADELEIVLTGSGGHASQPHSANDPVVAAAEIITALQVAVTRNVPVLDPAVCTITSIDAGRAHNIIPEEVTMRGTIRTLSKDTRNVMHSVVRRVVEGISSAHGMMAEVRVDNGYPPTINDPNATAEVLLAAQSIVGRSKVMDISMPSMGGEDWSYVLQEVPGVMAWLGACPPELTPETSPYNHSSRVVFDEDAMATGISLYAAAALNRVQ